MNTGFTFLGEAVAVHINIILLCLFVKLPISSISFPVLSCYGLFDLPVNLGAFFAVILSYLVLDRRELLLSEHKLENMFSFTCLIQYLSATRKFSRQGFFGIHLPTHESKAPYGKILEFFLRCTLKTRF